MTRRLLILTDAIAPPAYAPRIVSLCHYLYGQGWECVVFSDCEQDFEPFAADVGTWYQTRYYHSGNYRKQYAKDKLFGARERYFQAFIERTIEVQNFDAIFCSTCYFFPLQTTHRLASKYHKPFVVDLRDISEQWGDIPFMTQSPLPSQRLNRWLHRLFTRHNLRMRNRVLRAADAVVTISPWHRELLARYNPNTHLTYNGFDESEFTPQDVPSERFVIAYTGKIYDLHFRDPRLLLEAMCELTSSGQIKPSDVEIRFHIDKGSFEPLRQLVSQYGLSDICRIEGYIPRTELLPLMHRASVLLVLTCQSTPNGAHGIMGTKFYEALGVEKPVLCVRSDEECLAQVIGETNAGLAATNADEVKTFLTDKYREWKQHGFTHQAVDREQKQRFTRQHQAKQLEQLFLQCLRR